MRSYVLFLLLALVVVSGWQSPVQAQEHETELSSLFWPAPPAEPRIFFIKHIADFKDARVQKTFFKKIKDLVRGKQEQSLIRPMDIAVGEDGTLFIADAGAGTVNIYNPQTKRLSRIWQVDKRISLDSPVGVAIAPNNVIIIADSSLKKVFAVDFKGRSRFILGQDDGLLRPTGVFVREEKLYVVDTEAARVLVFDLQGKLLTKFGKKGKGPGEFNYPTHIYVHEDGKVYVSDTLNFRIQIFDVSGRFLKDIGEIGDGSGQFSRPKGIACDTFGHIYVTDALFDNFQVFDDSKNFLLSVGKTGEGDGEFWLPAGMAIDRNNVIYIADSYNKRINIFKYVGEQ